MSNEKRYIVTSAQLRALMSAAAAVEERKGRLALVIVERDAAITAVAESREALSHALFDCETTVAETVVEVRKETNDE